MSGFLDPELVRAVCRAPQPKRSTTRKKEKVVDERGLTPAMRELVDSKPKAPTPLPKLDCIVGSRIELIGLVGTERNWNGRRGTVTAKHLSMHPNNKNVRAWVLEIAFDKPITKTTFFSDHCRPLSPDDDIVLATGPKTSKKVKPNEPCPCGSGKKYKKCCAKKKGKTNRRGDNGTFNSMYDSTEITANVDSGRPPLRFNIGDLVQAFAGQGEWINGKVIKTWDQSNPYRIELEDGTNVWGPEDTANFVRDRTPLEPLRFNIGDKVLANALGGWKTGKIIMVWDHGNPYRIELEDGTNVWGPEDIDKFVVPWSKTLPPMPVPPEGWKDEEHGHSHGHGHGGGHNELNNSGHGHSHGGVACDGNHGDEKKEKEEEDGHGHSHGGVACDDGDLLAENDLHDVE